MKKRGTHAKKKSQIAVEHLIIVGLIIIILIPTAYFLFTYQGSSSDAIKASKIEGAANQIVKAANNLYNYGTESKTTIEVTIPEGVQSISFLENEVVFNYLTSSNEISQLAKVADTELVGVIIENPVPGTQKLEIINLNLRICVTLFGIACPFCSGVLVCDEEVYCNNYPDDVCPNEYFPLDYTGEICSITEGDTCYDPDCACTTGTGETGCNEGICVNGNCISCGLLTGWCSDDSQPYSTEEKCCVSGACVGNTGVICEA